jgi:hypothetical protein
MVHKDELLQGEGKITQAKKINIETAEEIGTLSATIYDQFRNKSNKIAIEEVYYLPNGTFNLFSLTQMTAKGLIMGCKSESIWIEKGHNKVVFDMKIPTPKGMLFLIYFTWDDTKLINVAKNTSGTKNLKAGEGRENVGFESREGSKES